MKSYKVILLDIDGTILDFHADEAAAFHATMESFKIPQSLWESYFIIYEKKNSALWKAAERGECNEEDIQNLRFDSPAFRQFYPDAREINDRYLSFLGQQHHELPGAKDACAKLSQGSTLYAATNGFENVQRSRIRSSSLSPYIQEVFSSQALGARKPDPAFFAKLLTCIGDPDKEDVLLIGDSLQADITGASAAGIDSCYICPETVPLSDSLPSRYQAKSIADFSALMP